LRTEQWLTQEERAYRAQLDRVPISMLERGKRRATLKSVDALAAALGVTFSEVARRLEHRVALRQALIPPAHLASVERFDSAKAHGTRPGAETLFP